ncbi:MAG: serine/threonine-protein kinase, partial [Calditrichia bacterium]
LKRFKKEIQSLQKIESPYVVKLLNFWIKSAFVAFEMEYIPGLSLEKLMKKLAAVPYPAKSDIILQLIYQITKGLTTLHQHDLVHRDIKPSNILILLKDYSEGTPTEDLLRRFQSEGITLRISDLGVVKDLSASVSITHTSDFLGTAAYISPEQAMGSRIDAFTDMYSLGVLWYELVGGKNPFQRKNIYQTISAHIKEEAPDIRSVSPQFPLDMAHVLMLLLQKNPSQRFYNSERLQLLIQNMTDTAAKSDFDISLLLNSHITKAEVCEGYEKLAKALLVAFEAQRWVYAIYENQQGRDHLLHHLIRHGFSNDFRTVYFFPNLHSDFFYSFPAAIMQQLAKKEVEEFGSSLSSDSMKFKFFELFQQNSFYGQCDHVRLNFQIMPPYIRMYNWIQFMTELFAFISRKIKILLLFDGLENVYPQHPVLLALLWTQIRSHSVYWLFPVPADFRKRTTMLNPQASPPPAIEIENYLVSYSPCLANGGRNRPWNLSSVPVNRQFAKQHSPKNQHFSFSPEEEDFLRYLALSGYSNPLEFINWILDKRFNRDGTILLSMIQKDILEDVPGVYRARQIAFQNRSIHAYILSGIKESEKIRRLQSIVGYWQTRDDLESKELLIHYLWELKEYSRFAHRLSHLLGFYNGISNMEHSQILAEWLPMLEQAYKIPTGLDILFNFHRIAEMSFTGKAEAALQIARDLYSVISEKYIYEKNILRFFIALNGITLKKPEVFEEIENRPFSPQPNPQSRMPEIDFLCSIHLFGQGNLEAAIKNLGETLIRFNRENQYWNIPTSSCLLAYFYFEKKNWEKAYRYSAMAFQAGRTMHDFWIMDRCLKLIDRNPYYQSNRNSLLDWQEFRKSLLKFPIKILDGVDIRSKILDFIH